MSVLISKLIVMLVDEATAPARALTRTIENLQMASKANAREMDEMRGRMVDAAAAAWAVGRALSRPIESAIAFESAMADVAKVSGFDDTGIEKFGADIRRLAISEIPMAATELAALAESAAASGIADEDLLDFTRMTAKAALAWGVTGAAAGEELAKIKTALRLSVSETMLMADAVNYLSDATAATAPDLTQFTRNVAAMGEFYGFSREESLAFGSAMISAGAEVEVASTSFRNLGRALTKGASATKAQREGFKALGLSAEAVALSMQENAVETTLDVIKRLGEAPAEARAAIMSQIFGDEARALAPLLTNVGILEDTLGLVADKSAYAGSVSQEFAKRMETTEFAMQRLKNQAEGVAMAIGFALLPAINAGADAIAPLLIAMADWAAANPEIVMATVALVGGLVALRVASLATRWAFLFMKGGLIDAALIATKSASAFLAIINPLNLVKNAFIAARAAMLMSGVGAIAIGLAMAGMWIYNNWSGLTAFFQAFGQAYLAALQPIMPAIEPIIDAGKRMLDWVMALVGPVDASAADWAAWGTSVGTAVGDAVMAVVNKGAEIIAWFQALPGHISAGVAGMAQAVTDAFADISQQTADAFLSIDWVGIGVTLMNNIWEGMKSIIPNMMAGLGNAIASLNPFGGGAPTASGPAPQYDPNDLPTPDYPARAAGGSIVGGQTYLVGEEGPELVTPSRSGWVHTASETSRALSGGGQGMAASAFHIGSLIIQAASDPETTADVVIRRLEQAYRDARAGIFTDTEYSG